MKIGPNEQCPCGSGKKHKRCCRYKQNQFTPPDLTQKVEFDEKNTNAMLTHGYLSCETHTVVPEFTNPQPVFGKNPSPLGHPGEYTVEYTLQPPHKTIPDSASFDHSANLQGGSLLKITTSIPRASNDPVVMQMHTMGHVEVSSEVIPPLRYDLHPNDEGYLSQIETKVRASSFAEAEKVSYEFLAPILSKLVFDHDVPLDISRVRLVEIGTGSYSVKFVQRPYKEVGLDRGKLTGLLTVPRLYHPLVFYREALSATSPMYQFLCFFKVLELTRKMRGERYAAIVQQAKADGVTPSVPSEVLEIDLWLAERLDPSIQDIVRGKKINKIIDEVLRPIRNRLAHAFLEDDDIATNAAEDLVNPKDVYMYLPLVKYIARYSVATEMKLAV